jgi:hypothetical protein
MKQLFPFYRKMEIPFCQEATIVSIRLTIIATNNLEMIPKVTKVSDDPLNQNSESGTLVEHC